MLYNYITDAMFLPDATWVIISQILIDKTIDRQNISCIYILNPNRYLPEASFFTKIYLAEAHRETNIKKFNWHIQIISLL